MSQENVEIVKAAIDAYNRGDWDAWLQHMAPGFESDMSRAVGPVSGVISLDHVDPTIAEGRSLRLGYISVTGRWL